MFVVAGRTQSLQRLVAQIKGPRSIIGVEPFDCDTGGRPPATIEAMADQATVDILKHQSKGPYSLVGFDIGGLIALEVARRLKAQGAKVASLCMIDSVFDRRHWPLGVKLAAALRRSSSDRFSKFEGQESRVQQLLCAIADYVPTAFDGEATLIITQSRQALGVDLAKLWSCHVKDIRVCPVTDDGDAVAALAERLARVWIDTRPDRRIRSPRVLVATSATWLNATRLALSLNEAGFRVEAVCLNRHSLASVGFVETVHRFNPLRPLASLRQAIERARPDIIVPCDDQVAAMLHCMSASADPQTADGVALQALIVRSLGAQANFPRLHARTDIMRIAGEECLRHPETAVVSDPATLTQWLDTWGFPAVLKTDGSWGGEGVAIVRNHAEAAKALGRLQCRPNPFRIVRRLLIKGDSGSLMGFLARRAPIVSVQTFEPGRAGNAAVACLKGEVLSAVYVEVIRSKGQTGPASVVRVLDHPEMTYAVETMVRRLGLSGFVGFDFVLDSNNGGACLIELNPRATPTCHLVTADGVDLATALSAALRHRPRRRVKPAQGFKIVALFPQELLRDPTSGFLSAAYHDVPWQSPELVALGMQATGRRGFRLPRFQRPMRENGLLKA